MSTKLATRRLIVSGDILELYEYEFPFSYNMAPMRMSGGQVSETDRPAELTRRRDNLQHVRQEIRRLIECNFKAHGYEPVFLTFTFRENITDVDIANAHFHDFIKRFNYRFKMRAKYLAIVEFQKRGAVHYHCIFFNVSLAIEQRERRERIIAGLWTHGYVDIERIRHAKSVSAYVCKYLNKAVHDRRLRGRKAFFTSRALLRPMQFRSESSIDKVLAEDRLDCIRVDTYESLSRGKVIFKTYVRRNDKGV